MPDKIITHNVERPCGHMQTVSVRAHQSIADYNFRVVPELQEAVQQPCEQCAKLDEGTKEKAVQKGKS